MRKSEYRTFWRGEMSRCHPNAGSVCDWLIKGNSKTMCCDLNSYYDFYFSTYSAHDLTYWFIHSLNTATRAKTVNMRCALQSVEPQLTAPWSTQNPSESLQTKGPPLSPWQPPSRVPGTPAQSICLVMPLPSIKSKTDEREIRSSEYMFWSLKFSSPRLAHIVHWGVWHNAPYSKRWLES